MQKRVDGKCLCGAVSVAVDLKDSAFAACHCSMCRKWGGGPAFTVDAGEHVAFTGEDAIGIYESSAWAERGFCKHCGTHLFYRMKNSTYWNLPLGLLEGSGDFRFQAQIFIDSKPGCYEFANPTEKMTEAEVIAKFGESQV